MELSCEIITRNKFLAERGAHPKDSILIVLEGSFSCETNGQTYNVCKNDIFFFKSGNTFKRKIISPVTAIYIIFDTLPFVSNQKIFPSNPTRMTEDIYFLADAAYRDDAKAINHFVNDILYCSMSSTRKPDPIIQGVLQYIQENYSQNLSLDLLAARFHISKQWLILRFKKEMNTTPVVYLNNYRMKKAKELLLKQEMSVGEIALACGFETPYYFSNAFKKSFGIPPTVWRKNMIL